MTYQGLRPRQQTTALDFLADNRNLNPTTTTEHQRMWHTDPTDAVFVGAVGEDLHTSHCGALPRTQTHNMHLGSA